MNQNEGQFNKRTTPATAIYLLFQTIIRATPNARMPPKAGGLAREAIERSRYGTGVLAQDIQARPRSGDGWASESSNQ
jgi:hypothetical protein